MDLNKCFEMCFPGLLKGEIEQSAESFEIEQMPYKLSYKHVRNYSTYKCTYCSQNLCDDCLVPFDDENIQSVLDKVKIEANDNLFSSKSYSRTDDVQVNLVWH